MKRHINSKVLFVICAAALLMTWGYITYSNWQKESGLIKRDWGLAMNAVNTAAEAVIKKGNQSKMLPLDIKALGLPEVCADVIYLVDNSQANEAIVAYPVLGVPSYPRLFRIYFVEIKPSSQKHTAQEFSGQGINSATWHEFCEIVGRRSWVMQVAHLGGLQNSGQ